MICIPASDRLTELAFEADEDWQTYPLSRYTCPHCGKEVAFALKDLDKHSRSTFTNLSAEDAEAASHAAEQSGQEFNSFLDFYCPGCRRPVRIYYFSWAGGRYTYGHNMKFIVEAPLPLR